MGPLSLPERLGLDTSCFVYYMEDPLDSPRRRFLHERVFQPMAAGGMDGVTSAVTVAELLVAAYASDEPDRAAELRAAVEAIPNLRIVPVDTELAARAARIRGRTGASLPDAIQAAACLAAGAEALLTNDTDLRRLAGVIDVLILDELVPSETDDSRGS